MFCFSLRAILLVLDLICCSEIEPLQYNLIVQTLFYVSNQIMVNRVDDSFDCYRETNRELARQNEELKLMNSELQAKLHQKEIEKHRSELEQRQLISQKDAQLTQKDAQLRQKDKLIKDLMIDSERYNAIVAIITEPPPAVDTIVGSSLLALPEPSIHKSYNVDNQELSSLSQTTLAQASLPPDEDEEEEEEDKGETVGGEEEQQGIPLENITEEDEIEEDSLMPPEVTSVPPLVEERILHTSSVFNCLGATPLPPARKKLSHDGSEDEMRASNQTLQQNSHFPQSFHETDILRHSITNFESNSPIQNFQISKITKANNMLQSTPIKVKFSASQTVINDASIKNVERIKRKPAKRGPPVDSAPRYNLRKRNKA